MNIPSIEYINHFKGVYGAFSVSEMFALYNIILEAPPGVYCECGVYKGKSASVASYVLKHGAFHLVEPEFKDEQWVNDTILSVSKYANERIKIIPHNSTSIEFLPSILNNDWVKKYSYVMIDSGDHQSLPMIEVKILEDLMVSGGIIAFHDLNSQFLQVREAYDYLLSTGKYDEISINWDEIISYVNENNLEDGNESWHHRELQNPCFVGAVKRK